MNRIQESINKQALADHLFTETLKALEQGDRKKALLLIKEGQEQTESLEQYLAFNTLRSLSKKETTFIKNYLNNLYNLF